MTVLTQGQVSEHPKTMKWTRERYYEAVEANVLREDDKIELIGGDLVTEGLLDRMPQNTRHQYVVVQLNAVLIDAFRGGFHVRPQLPLALLEDSDPEPDMAIVEGLPQAYRTVPPHSAALVVEVSDTSLAYDRGHKGSLYAAAGIADYWIVNLVDSQVEVHREPVADASEPFGSGYTSVTVSRAGESISPLARPEVSIEVASLLP